MFDPKKAAVVILAGIDRAEPDEEEGDAGPAAVRGFYDALKSGDYDTAFDALKAAISYCDED